MGVALLCACPRTKLNARTLFPERITAMHVAIRVNSIESVRLLLANPTMQLDEHEYMREKPIDIAAKMGPSHAAITELLQSYADGASMQSELANDITQADQDDGTSISVKHKEKGCEFLGEITTANYALEKELQTALAKYPISAVSEWSVHQSQFSSDCASAELQLTLSDSCDQSSPLFCGTLYSLLLLAGAGLLSAWFGRSEKNDVHISVASSAVTHGQACPDNTMRIAISTTHVTPLISSGTDNMLVKCCVKGADGHNSDGRNFGGADVTFNVSIDQACQQNV